VGVNQPTFLIRKRTLPEDGTIRHLNGTAFGSADEFRLIEDLRAALI